MAARRLSLVVHSELNLLSRAQPRRRVSVPSSCFHSSTPSIKPQLPNTNLLSLLSARFQDYSMRTHVDGLRRVTIPDAIKIWIEAVKKETGVEAIEVDDEVREAMEEKLVELFEARMVDYEEFLNVMVPLIQPKVSHEMEVDLANELLDTYFPEILETKNTALGIMTAEHLTSIQKIKIRVYK